MLLLFEIVHDFLLNGIVSNRLVGRILLNRLLLQLQWTMFTIPIRWLKALSYNFMVPSIHWIFVVTHRTKLPFLAIAMQIQWHFTNGGASPFPPPRPSLPDPQMIRSSIDFTIFHKFLSGLWIRFVFIHFDMRSNYSDIYRKQPPPHTKRLLSSQLITIDRVAWCGIFHHIQWRATHNNTKRQTRKIKCIPSKNSPAIG